LSSLLDFDLPLNGAIDKSVLKIEQVRLLPRAKQQLLMKNAGHGDPTSSALKSPRMRA
jgi:hypothetical protein